MLLVLDIAGLAGGASCMQLRMLLVLGGVGLGSSMQLCVLLLLGAAGLVKSIRLCALLVLGPASAVQCAVCADIQLQQLGADTGPVVSTCRGFLPCKLARADS